MKSEKAKRVDQQEEGQTKERGARKTQKQERSTTTKISKARHQQENEREV